MSAQHFDPGAIAPVVVRRDHARAASLVQSGVFEASVFDAEVFVLEWEMAADEAPPASSVAVSIDR